MLKIRLMGTKKNIKWFRHILEKELWWKVLDISDVFTNKGTTRYYRCYAEIERKISENS